MDGDEWEKRRRKEENKTKYKKNQTTPDGVGEKKKSGVWERKLGRCIGHWVNGVGEEWGENHTGRCGRKTKDEEI